MIKIQHTKPLLYIIFITILFSGCTLRIGKASFGYSTSGASISPELKTVYVAPFVNRATLIEPTLAQKISDKLKDKVLAQTNLKVVNRSGDVNFDGAIEVFGTSPMAVSGGQTVVAQQTRLTIGVKITYHNLKEPITDFETSFSKYKDYDSRLTLAAAEGQFLDKLIDDLVEDIFNKAFVNW